MTITTNTTTTCPACTQPVRNAGPDYILTCRCPPATRSEWSRIAELDLAGTAPAGEDTGRPIDYEISRALLRGSRHRTPTR